MIANKNVSRYLEIDKLYTHLCTHVSVSLIEGVIQYALRRHCSVVNCESNLVFFLLFNVYRYFFPEKCIRKSLCAT